MLNRNTTPEELKARHKKETVEKMKEIYKVIRTEDNDNPFNETLKRIDDLQEYNAKLFLGFILCITIIVLLFFGLSWVVSLFYSK